MPRSDHLVAQVLDPAVKWGEDDSDLVLDFGGSTRRTLGLLQGESLVAVAQFDLPEEAGSSLRSRSPGVNLYRTHHISRSSHLLVKKTVRDGHAHTTVKLLDEDQRRREITRLLSCLEESGSGQAHAEELLALGDEYRTV